MKKMVMLIAVAVLASFAQAAYVDWQATGLSTYKNQAFYLFDSSNSSDVLAVLAAVDDNTAATLSGMALTSGTVTSKGKISALGTDVGSATSVFALVLGGEIADGTEFITITESVSSLAYTPPATSPGTFSSTIATAGTKGTMSAGGGGDVPEPTSGLLLLVGGAMLALRRKQK